MRDPSFEESCEPGRLLGPSGALLLDPGVQKLQTVLSLEGGDGLVVPLQEPTLRIVGVMFGSM